MVGSIIYFHFSQTNERSCQKQQTRAYILSKIGKIKLFRVKAAEGPEKKQSIEEFTNSLISCVKRGDTTCKGSFFFFASNGTVFLNLQQFVTPLTIFV